MRGARGRLLYVGKAVNLRRRAQSYFRHSTNNTNGNRITRMETDPRIRKMASLVTKIDFKRTASALEALILEAALIKKHQPPYNVREKDDTSFLYVVVTKERFPRVMLARRREAGELGGAAFGPFVQGASIREALRILRKIFPWSAHRPAEIGAFKRACVEYELGLCPGTCIGAADEKEYGANIRRLKQFFQGKRKTILYELARAMNTAAAREEFEKAAVSRRQIFALRHIQDVALVKDNDHFQFPTRLPDGQVSHFQERMRIEGYDVSNISGTSATGSMVVFRGDRPAKEEYRLFKIHTLNAPNDVGMLREVLARRFKRTSPAGGWPLPDLILIDGGKGQVNAARTALEDAGFVIPVVGLAKGPTRKKTDVVGEAPEGVSLQTLVRVRDEAHRFARSYHIRLRGRAFRMG